MVVAEIREQLPEDALVFDNASYDKSIIGVTLDGRVIYDFDLMVEEFAEENECSYIEAVEWIEYNTIRSLPYAGEKAPLIVYTDCTV
jgi:hypothetical protein